ncbi:MAG: (2Fe-2S) ferredoxin domain-containing protein [Cyanobacteria bacterium J06638_20]
MLNVKQLPPRLFNLEGTFLGFLGGEPKKPKSIVLEVDQEHISIQLPKELRAHAKSSLKVGDRLCCLGKSQVDFKAGIIKLKAYQVFFLAPTEATVPTSASTSWPLPTSQSPCTSSQPKRSKILVCRKSGCQKRGGHKMVAALEKVLQDYQLQDQVEISYTGCQKRCSKAPTLTVMPGKHHYESINPRDLAAVVEEHFCSHA